MGPPAAKRSRPPAARGAAKGGRGQDKRQKTQVATMSPFMLLQLHFSTAAERRTVAPATVVS